MEKHYKEKAEQLIKKFVNVKINGIYADVEIDYAKKYAIIVCDECINDYSLNSIYWKKVKRQIKIYDYNREVTVK